LCRGNLTDSSVDVAELFGNVFFVHLKVRQGPRALLDVALERDAPPVLLALVHSLVQQVFDLFQLGLHQVLTVQRFE
jgi:hypothetical protein